MLCMPGLPAIWQAGLGQGHNQKKDTHTLDFDVILTPAHKVPLPRTEGYPMKFR
jgi:hypothetical protein